MQPSIPPLPIYTEDLKWPNVRPIHLPNQSNNVNNTTNDPTVYHSTNSVFVIWTRQELYLLAMCMCVSAVQSPGLCVIQISIQWDFHNMEYVQFLEIGTILRKSIYSLTTAHRPYPPHSRTAHIQADVPLFELTTRYWQTRCSLPAKVIIILCTYYWLLGTRPIISRLGRWLVRTNHLNVVIGFCIVIY